MLSVRLVHAAISYETDPSPQEESYKKYLGSKVRSASPVFITHLGFYKLTTHPGKATPMVGRKPPVTASTFVRTEHNLVSKTCKDTTHPPPPQSVTANLSYCWNRS